MALKNNMASHATWLAKEEPQVPKNDLISHLLQKYSPTIAAKHPSLNGVHALSRLPNVTKSFPGSSASNVLPSALERDKENSTYKSNGLNSVHIPIAKSMESRKRQTTIDMPPSLARNGSLTLKTDTAVSSNRRNDLSPVRSRVDVPASLRISQSDNSTQNTLKRLLNECEAPAKKHRRDQSASNSTQITSKDILLGLSGTENQLKLLESLSPGLESILRQIIDKQEEKLNLLEERFHISESTSISLDAKKDFYLSILPKLTKLSSDLESLKENLGVIPSSTQVNSVVLTTYHPIPVIDQSSQKHYRAPSPREPIIELSSGKSDPILESFSKNLQNEHLSIDLSDDMIEVTDQDFATNINEARDFVMERRQNSVLQVESSVPRKSLFSDDEEDHFGEDSMDGLRTPTQERDDVDDMSGFVDPEESELDHTFTELSDNSDIESTTNDVVGDVLEDEIENIKLSQDVAEKFGIDYNKLDPADSIEEVIEDDESASSADDEIEEIDDFTTQMNEERELNNDVIEILSDDDADLEFDYNLPIKVEKASPIKAIANLNVPISDNDFSDDSDDDELMQIISGAKPIPGSAEREVPPGTEHFIDEVYSALNDVFKLKSFRQNQLSAICSLLLGRDVFVLMPTGGGKSLCYQLPALVTGGKTQGTTIVISPLISLMQDQVDHLIKRGLRAGMISSKATKDGNRETMNQFREGVLQLVYLSPEMCNKSILVQKIIARLYDNKQLARVVIDEAHCLSSWGHDFRPDYKEMSIFKEKYPQVPLMALTATANEKVKKDIVRHLKMTDPVLLKQSFNRSNLYYTIKKKDNNHIAWIKDYVQNQQRNGTGIIYCSTRVNCEKMSESLNQAGLRTSFYHAGMSPDERSTVQHMWQTGDLQLICATVAFGMGIDKPDVRFVIHLTIPRNLEGYYQETGRAGRDGKQSDCIMLYSLSDARSIQGMIQRDKELTYEGKRNHSEKLEQVVQYCSNMVDCRRKQVLHYFNENFDLKLCNKQCDNCKFKHLNTEIEKDCTENSRDIIKLVQATGGERVTLIQCQDIFKGAKTSKLIQMGHNNNPYYGKGKNLDKQDIERIFLALLMGNYITEYQVSTGAFHSNYLKLGEKADQLFHGSEKVILKFNSAVKTTSRDRDMRPPTSSETNNLRAFKYTESFQTAREVQRTSIIDLPSSLSLTSQEEKSYEHSYNELNKVRIDVLNELNILPNHAIGETTFKDMAIKIPTNKKDFAKLKDITKSQIEHFNYFKKTLMNLARERKQDNGTSPYFNSTQTGTGKLPTPSKPVYKGKKTYRRSQKASQKSSQRSSQKSSQKPKTKKGLPL